MKIVFYSIIIVFSTGVFIILFFFLISPAHLNRPTRKKRPLGRKPNSPWRLTRVKPSMELSVFTLKTWCISHQTFCNKIVLENHFGCFGHVVCGIGVFVASGFTIGDGLLHGFHSTIRVSRGVFGLPSAFTSQAGLVPRVGHLQFPLPDTLRVTSNTPTFRAYLWKDKPPNDFNGNWIKSSHPLSCIIGVSGTSQEPGGFLEILEISSLLGHTLSRSRRFFLFFGISIWSTWSFLKGVRINATWSKPQSVFPPYTTNASFGIQPGKPNPTTKRSKTFSSLGVSRHHVFNGLANGILWRRDEPEPDFPQSRGVRFSAVKVKVAFWNHPQQYGKPFDSLDLNPERRTSHQEFLWMVWTSHQKLCRNLFWFVEE